MNGTCAGSVVIIVATGQSVFDYELPRLVNPGHFHVGPSDVTMLSCLSFLYTLVALTMPFACKHCFARSQTVMNAAGALPSHS